MVDLRRARRVCSPAGAGIAAGHELAGIAGRPVLTARPATGSTGLSGRLLPAGAWPAAWSGWFIIRPVNAVLGWFFRGFNRGFDGMTAGYGWMVGKLLRLSVMVLLVYGGLLVLTVLRSSRARRPASFRSRTRAGSSSTSSCPIRRRWNGPRRPWPRSSRSPAKRPGVGHTVTICGHLVPPAGQQPQLRLDVRRPRTVRRAARARA